MALALSPSLASQSWSSEMGQSFDATNNQQIASFAFGSISGATATVSVISRQMIRDSGARYLTDVLRMVPGMEVIRTLSTESNASVRGFNDASSAAQGIKVMINGHSVYNQFYGNAFFDTLPVSLEDIDRIEVIRGPGSFLYGPNAMHGVIDIITTPIGPREGQNNDRYSFSTKAGTYHSTVTTLRYHRWDEERTAGVQATVLYDDIGQFDPGLGDTRNKQLFSMSYHDQIGGDESHTFDLGGSITDQRFNLLLPPVAIINSTSFIADMRESRFHSNYRYGDFKVKASWTGFEAESTAQNYYDPVNVDLDTYEFDARYSFELIKDHHVTVGGGIEHSTFTTFDPDVSLGRHSTTVRSAYVQDEVTLIDKHLFFTMGARFDHHSEVGNNVSPRAALVWKFLERHSVRASYGTGYRTPSHRELWFDLDVNVPGVPFPLTIEGNDQLVAEQIRSLELGYTGSFLPSPKVDGESKEGEESDDATRDRLTVGVSLYHNRVDHQIGFPPNSTRPENLDDDEAFGAELEARYLLFDEVFTFANYSLGARRARDSHLYNPLAPRNKGNVGIHYTEHTQGSGGGWRAMCWLTLFGETTAPVDRHVGDYLMVNGSLSYEWTHENNRTTSVFLEGSNMIGDQHREHPDGDDYGAILMFGARVSF